MALRLQGDSTVLISLAFSLSSKPPTPTPTCYFLFDSLVFPPVEEKATPMDPTHPTTDRTSFCFPIGGAVHPKIQFRYLLLLHFTPYKHCKFIMATANLQHYFTLSLY